MSNPGPPKDEGWLPTMDFRQIFQTRKRQVGDSVHTFSFELGRTIVQRRYVTRHPLMEGQVRPKREEWFDLPVIEEEV